MTTTPTPTLLVFTLGAARERLRRPLLPANHGGAEVELRRACRGAALEAGRGAGCRLVVSGPAGLAVDPDVQLQVQRGAGFGERLEGACRRAGVDGGPLVVVGTDVPGLREQHVARALALLAEDPDRVVLGPSPDGGFYLLATARPLPGLARLTRWCRRDTLGRLRSALERGGRPVVLLEPLRDLDSRRDLERWIARGAPGARAGAANRVEAPAAVHPAPTTALPVAAVRGDRPAAVAPAVSPAVSPWLSAIWRFLIRHLARILATLRRLPSRDRLPAPRLVAVPVRSPRGPPLRRR